MIATVGKFLSYTLGGEAGEIESVCSFFSLSQVRVEGEMQICCQSCDN